MTQADFLTWFGKWKDVTTAIVAICAIIVVVFQILQAGQFERNKVRREQVAARATLPLTLAALSEYGANMMKALAPLEAWLENGHLTPAPEFNGPRLPPETVASVEKVITAYPNEDVAKALAAMLSEVQLLQSRSRDYSMNEESIRIWSVAMKDNVVMAASIVARCENLFAFARHGSEYGDPSRSHIEQVLNGAMLWQGSYARVWKSVERYPDREPASLLKPRPLQAAKAWISNVIGKHVAS